MTGGQPPTIEQVANFAAMSLAKVLGHPVSAEACRWMLLREPELEDTWRARHAAAQARIDELAERYLSPAYPPDEAP